MLSPSAPTAPLVFLMNSLLDILFFTWGELRSTESRIKEKHITYLIRLDDQEFRMIVIIIFDQDAVKM